MEVKEKLLHMDEASYDQLVKAVLHTSNRPEQIIETLLNNKVVSIDEVAVRKIFEENKDPSTHPSFFAIVESIRYVLDMFDNPQRIYAFDVVQVLRRRIMGEKE